MRVREFESGNSSGTRHQAWQKMQTEEEATYIARIFESDVVGRGARGAGGHRQIQLRVQNALVRVLRRDRARLRNQSGRGARESTSQGRGATAETVCLL